MKQKTNATFIVLLFALIAFSSCRKTEEEIRRERVLDRIERLSSENKFILNSFDMSVVCNTGNAFGPASKQMVLQLFAHAYVGFRPELITASSVSFGDEGEVQLTIPHCELLTLDVEDEYTVYRDNSFFLPDYTRQDLDSLAKQGEAKFYERIKEKKLLEIADDREVKFFKSMLSSMGFAQNKCTIKFREL